MQECSIKLTKYVRPTFENKSVNSRNRLLYLGNSLIIT